MCLKFFFIHSKEKMNFAISEEDTICSFCLVSWIGQNPRCLPCKESVHIFCSDCLEKFARHNRLKIGETLHCPVCDFAHSWTNDGVLGFPRLTIFDKLQTGEKFNRNERVYMENISLNKEKSEIEKAIISAIKNTSLEEDEIFKKVHDTFKIRISDMQEIKEKLIKEIIDYYNDRETNLKEIIKEFEAIELFSDKIGENEFKENFMEMRVKLTNKAMKLLNKTINFKVNNNNKDNEMLNIGENIIAENLTIDYELINLPSFKNIITLNCYKNYLYLIMEKYINKSFIYRLVLYDTTSDRFDFLHEWKSSRQRQYKLAINNDIYLLLIGDREIKYLKEIIRKDNRNFCKFESFCFTDKNTEYYNGIMDFQNGIIASSTILEQKLQIFKIRNPYKIEWNLLYNQTGEWYINI